jgi:hypothetical protein
MPSAMEQAGTRKIGPRALTFLAQPTAAPLVLTNCRKALAAAAKPFVLGEDYTTDTVAPLVDGWWRIQLVLGQRTFVAQVNARQVGSDPFKRGIMLGGGAAPSFDFFVDDALIDGILVLQQCGQGGVAQCNSGQAFPLAIVNRLESVLLPSETGDTTSASTKRPTPAAENACGPLAGP